MLEGVSSHLSVQSCVGAQQLTTFQSLIRDENRTSHLDKLPLEIIQRIASHGSCKAVLALQRVCRVLYHACSAVSIVKHILERSSIQASDCAASSSSAWYDIVLSLRDPLSSWTRYAVANEKFEYFISSREADRLRQSQFASWLPQLLASHCEWGFAKTE